jgi:hypothetical protein
MAYLYPQGTPIIQTKYFTFYLSIDWLFALNRGWKLDSLQIMILVLCLLYMQLSWTKNASWNLKSEKWRKWWKFVSPYLFNNTYGLPVLTFDTKCTNRVFYDWLVLNSGWKRDPPNYVIRICLLNMKHSWT